MRVRSIRRLYAVICGRQAEDFGVPVGPAKASAGANQKNRQMDAPNQRLSYRSGDQKKLKIRSTKRSMYYR